MKRASLGFVALLSAAPLAAGAPADSGHDEIYVSNEAGTVTSYARTAANDTTSRRS
jgi:hypothetical protein